MQKRAELSYADSFVDVLEPGETLKWTGQPRKGLVFRAGDAAAIPFSLLWCGFACFWEASVLGLTGPIRTANSPLLFKLWGIPFVIVGIYLVVGRFFFDAWRRSRTFYAVTNSRILILERSFYLKVTSLALRSLPAIVRTMRGSDEGSLSFGVPTVPTRGSKGVQFGGTPTSPTFEFIRGVRDVEELIRGSEASLRMTGVNSNPPS